MYPCKTYVFKFRQLFDFLTCALQPVSSTELSFEIVSSSNIYSFLFFKGFSFLMTFIFPLHILHSSFVLFVSLSAVHYLQYTVFSTLSAVHYLQYTIYSTLSVVHFLKCTICSSRSALHYLQYTIAVHYLHYTIAVHFLQYTIAVHYLQYTTSSTISAD